MEENQVLYDDTVQLRSRFISFVGEQRYDLCLIYSDRFYGKSLVLNLLNNRFAIIGQDDLDTEGYLEEAFVLSEEEAAELKMFLVGII